MVLKAWKGELEQPHARQLLNSGRLVRKVERLIAKLDGVESARDGEDETSGDGDVA